MSGLDELVWGIILLSSHSKTVMFWGAVFRLVLLQCWLLTHTIFLVPVLMSWMGLVYRYVHVLIIACPLVPFVCITEFSKKILYSQVLALWTGGSLARKHVTYSTWTVCVMANCHVCRFSRRIVGQDTEPSDFDLDSDYFFFFGLGNSARGEYLAVVLTAHSTEQPAYRHYFSHTHIAYIHRFI